jgi:hypothetical protein
MSNSSRCRKSAISVTGLLMLLSSLPASAGEFMTPEFARGEYRPISMVLIPPMAEVMKDKVTTTESMIAEAAGLEDAAGLVLREQLRAKGYELRILSVDQVNDDPVLRQMVRSMNERYDADIVQAMKKPKDIRTRRYNFGDEAKVLAAKLDADALIVSRIAASGASGGQKTMAVLIGGSMGYAVVSIGIVAGDNGDLEAFFDGSVGNMSPEQLEREPKEVMSKITTSALKKFPAHDAAAKYKKSWPQDSNRQVPDKAVSDDDVLMDLEALFEETPETSVAEPEEASPEELVPVEEQMD